MNSDQPESGRKSVLIEHKGTERIGRGARAQVQCGKAATPSGSPGAQKGLQRTEIEASGTLRSRYTSWKN